MSVKRKMSRNTEVGYYAPTRAAQTAMAPARYAFEYPTRKKDPVSPEATRRIAAIEVAYRAGEMSRQEFEERRRSYEYFGQREAAGYPAFNLRY